MDFDSEKHTTNDTFTDASNTKFSPALLAEYFQSGAGLNSTLLAQLINDNSENNVLRQTVINNINKGLTQKLRCKQYSDDITINEQLTSEEQTQLQRTFDDLDINFTNKVNHSHAFASASRKCERKILLHKLGVDVTVDHRKIVVKDVGGDPISSALLGEKNVHSCTPFLSNYDSTRYANRLHRARVALNGVIENNFQKELLTAYCKADPFKSEDFTHFCFSKSQHCKIRADCLLLLHSNYDINLVDLGDAMDSAAALIAYGSFIFSPKIFTEDSGKISWINASYRIERSGLCNKRDKIYFSFDNCSGFNYVHDYETYISYASFSQFSSRSGSNFSLELLENRSGVQFFRVTRLIKAVTSSLRHRIHLDHLKGKYLVRFPYFRYREEAGVHYPGKAVVLKPSVLLKSSYWKNLPKNTEWIEYIVDADVVDRTCAYVLSATEEKFKPDQIVNYLRSITTREVMYTTVLQKRELPNLEKLSALAHAIYVTVYSTKYVMGKALQQAILNVNALRNHSVPNNVHSEFDYKRGIFKRFVDFVLSRKHNNMKFNPKQFIVSPSEYIEFETTLHGTTLDEVFDKDNIRSSENFEPIVVSQITAGNSPIMKLEPISLQAKPDEFTPYIENNLVVRGVKSLVQEFNKIPPPKPKRSRDSLLKLKLSFKGKLFDTSIFKRKTTVSDEPIYTALNRTTTLLPKYSVATEKIFPIGSNSVTLQVLRRRVSESLEMIFFDPTRDSPPVPPPRKNRKDLKINEMPLTLVEVIPDPVTETHVPTPTPTYAVVQKNYPRLGRFTSDNSLIDVDGSRNECCILALVEDREFNVTEFRELVRNLKNPASTDDLHHELIPGNMAGSAVIQEFVELFNIAVVVKTTRFADQIFNPTNGFKPTRYITLVLRDQHYYIENNCRFNYPIQYRRDKMFKKIILANELAILSKKISFKVVSLDCTVESGSRGCFFRNNLAKYCNIHYECKNSRLLRYAKSLFDPKQDLSLVSLLCVFETDNFDVDFLRYVSSVLPNLGVRFIDHKVDGYFFAILHHCSPGSRNIVADYEHFRSHVCGNGSVVSLNGVHNFYEFCSEKVSQVQYSPCSSPNLHIVLSKRESNEKTIGYKSRTKIQLFGNAQNSFCSNMQVLAHEVAHILPCSTFRYETILLESVFSNNSTLVDLLKEKCKFLHLDIKPSEIVDSSLIVPCFDDSTELGKRKNAMLEQCALWVSERERVVASLKMIYEAYTLDTSSPINVVDVSAVLFDLGSSSFTVGLNKNPPYEWGYSADGLINTAELFNTRGEVNIEVAREFRKKGYLYIAFNAASKYIHGIQLANLYAPNEVDSLTEIPLRIVQGVPGAGKTEYILRNQESASNVVLTITREARADMQRRAEKAGICVPLDRIKTVDSYLINNPHGLGTVEEVWIDEALMVHAGLWFWVGLVSGCKRINVVGDRAQIGYINRSNVSVCYSSPNNLVFDEHFLTVDHRNPLDIVYWLHKSKFYSFNVAGTSTVAESSVKNRRINGCTDIPNIPETKYLTFIQSDKATLVQAGYDACTIHEFQGSQAQDIVVVRLNTKLDGGIFSQKAHILVALTRHRKSFVYCSTVPGDALWKSVNTISQYTKHQRLSVRHTLLGGSDRIEKPDRAVVLYKEDRDLRNILLKNGGTGYVSWQYRLDRKFDIPEKYELDHYYSGNPFVLQDFLDRAIPGSSTQFRQFDHDLFEHSQAPVDITGMSVGFNVPIFKKYDRLEAVVRSSIQYPLHVSQKISIKAFNERNGQVPQLQGLIDNHREALKLLNDFKKLCPRAKDFQSNPILPDLSGLKEWVAGQPPVVVKIIKSEEAFLDQHFTLYDFIVKAIPKIDLEFGAEFRYKASQTIAYQTKTINSVFCPILKNLMDRVEYSLHEDIILYNNMSPVEFAQLFTTTFPSSRYEVLNKFLEIDFSKYDKSQGLIILIFEALLMEWLGVPLGYIKLWLIMHRYSTVRDRVAKISADVEYQRKSGDPGTWRFNTLVQIAVLNRVLKLWVLILTRRVVACFSGDDSLIFTDYIFQNFDESIDRLQYVYNLEAKVMHFSIPYFCSKFLLLVEDEWIFVPDTLKLIVKLGRCDLVDFDHVECYRVSFDDNLYYYKNVRFWPYISFAIADRYKITGEHDIVFRTLCSVVKDKETFAKLYYKPAGAVLGNISTKPKLEL